jgi:hypothetical protein
MNYRCLLFILCLSVAGANDSGARPRPSAIQYLSPLPGAKLVSRETNVIVRFAGGLDRYAVDPAARFTVVGSRSGLHSGTSVVCDDNETILFEPDAPFAPGEDVTVTVRYRHRQRVESESFTFVFSISPKRTKPDLPKPRQFFAAHGIGWDRASGRGQRDRQLRETADFAPPVGFPTMNIGVVDDPGDGFVFLTNFLWVNDPPPSFLMILRNDGTPYFFRRSNSFVLDFKRQSEELLSYYEFGSPGFIVLDSTYTNVDLCACGNGYTVDPHDLQILDNGHHLIICADRQQIDMSQIVPGGNPDAVVIGMVFQELDRSNNVVFEWRSWDHFQITDAIGVDFTDSIVDYVHANALVPDHDGNWLASSRHLSEITKIDRSTGDIIWRWGGKNNQFRFVGDIDDSTGFHYQHDIRRLENGNYMLYDNGNFHTPPHSRAVEYRLDTNDMTATRVWQYRETPDIYANFMGSSQRLPGGNTVIAWGGSVFQPITTLTEVRPDGSKAFELTLTNGTLNYKGYRFPWSGTAPEPYLWEGPFDRQTQTLTLGFDKFGDERVVLYELYAAMGSIPLVLYDSVAVNSVELTGLTPGEKFRFRVRAVDGHSNRSPFSNEISFRYDNTGPAPVGLVGPADGSVLESAGVELTWSKSVDGEGDVLTYAVHILTGADGDAIVIDGIADTSYVYNRSGATPLTEFRWTVCCSDHQFTTSSPDTFTVRSARAGFGVPTSAVLHQNFPNPFNPTTTIRFDLNRGGKVLLDIFNVRGQNVRTLIDETRPAGFWSVEWDGLNNSGVPVGSGVYLYRLTAPGISQAQKMLIVR